MRLTKKRWYRSLVPSGERIRVTTVQFLIALVVLSAWEFLPRVSYLSSRSHLLDTFFISSPTRIFATLQDLITGRNGAVSIWPFIGPTLWASLLGTTIGLLSGALLGLVLSNFSFLSKVLGPYVVAANAVPRIALIPIVILLVGPTFEASIVICVLVVFFVAFFNAFEGGVSVPPHLLQNAAILGANKGQIMVHIRFPYVVAWTLAALPLASTFGVISVVTGEIFTGYPGLGTLVYTASVTADASLTFAVVIVLSVVGVAVVGCASLVKRRVLHWWVA